MVTLRAETDDQAETRREKQQWENYVDPKDKRPDDEFFDLQMMQNEALEQVVYDGGAMTKIVIEPATFPTHRIVQDSDFVYYIHETRYDNGQLVNLMERRRQVDKFEMSDRGKLEHLRSAFKTMRKGEIAWFKFTPELHQEIYHKHFSKDHVADDAVIGRFLFVKLSCDNVKRNPQCKKKPTYPELRSFFDEVRQICKEAVIEQDLSNAEKIYKSCLGSFRNIPKKEREALSEEDLKNRDETMVILNLNLAFCLLKRKEAKQALKYAEEAKLLDPNSSKAFYRCYQAHKITNTLSPARRNLHKAIELEPGNKVMRQEYATLTEAKSERER